MNEQVLSIKQMQELKKLGIDISKASMCWNTYDFFLIANNSDLKDVFNYLDDDWMPTFTLQDILNILPKCIKTEDAIYTLFLCPNDLYDGYIVAYMDDSNELTHLKGGSQYSSVSFLEAAFNMLKWCKENNYIKRKRSI